MRTFLFGTVMSCRHFTTENSFPSLPPPRVNLNWAKIEKCFGTSVPDPIMQSVDGYLATKGKNCASICAFRANDECTSCYHYCEECLGESILSLAQNVDVVFDDFCSLGKGDI